MRYEFQESDWKKYRELTTEWRERYLKRQNAEIAAFLQDESQTATERFWGAQKKIEDEAEILVKCFDPHARSRMQMALLLMLRYGLVEESDLAVFSDELQGRLKRASRDLQD